MNRKFINFLTISLSIFVVSSCGSTNKNVHSFTEEFLYDNEKHWKECTDLGCVQQIDVALHEFLQWETIKEATCNEPGKATSKCSVCNYVAEKEIPLIDHIIDSSWSNDSSFHWHTCQNDSNEKVDYNAHAFEWVYSSKPTCTSSGRGHQECTVCGYKLPEQDIPAKGHSWVVDEESTTYATCTTSGDITHRCSECNATETKHVEASHSWLAPTYAWDDEYTKVVAKRVCSSDATHIEQETVGVIKTHTPATCSEEGNNTYVSKSFSNTAFSTQSKIISIPKCGDTLEHVCTAIGYSGGEIYDECTVCHTKYNYRQLSQPWVDYDAFANMTLEPVKSNNKGESSSFDYDTKIATLKEFSGNKSSLLFSVNEPIPESIGKSYFVMEYTLIKPTGAPGTWWDTYLNVGGLGEASKIRFGKISPEAVAASEMHKATFYKDGEEVSWNAISDNETGVVYVDISLLSGGVKTIEISSDGGCQLRIDKIGFRSTKCEHDISCYSSKIVSSLAGLSTQSYDFCSECGYKNNVKSTGIPEGYTAINLSSPSGVRGESSCYEYNNHVITLPNTYFYGPKFTAPKGNKLLLELALDWNDNLTSSENASVEIFFFNNEQSTDNPSDYLFNHNYKFTIKLDSLVSTAEGVSSPASISDVGNLLNSKTGLPESEIARNNAFVLELDISNNSLSQFSQILVSGSQGSIVTIYNAIYI